MKRETKIYTVAAVIPALITLLALAPFPQGIKIIGDIVFQERADHATAPASGTGILWVRSSDNALVYTGEGGTDTALGAGGGGSFASSDITGKTEVTPEAGDFLIGTDGSDGDALKKFDADNFLAGAGDVDGPASSTDHALARFDGENGKLLQNGVGVLTDAGDLSGIDDISLSGLVDGRDVANDGTKLDGIENGATADQSDAEIETAYNNQVSIVGQAEAEAGVATTVRRWTAERVAQAIAALAPGGGDPTYGSDAGASDDAVYVDADDEVGIGTTTPTEEIDIYRTDSAPRLKLTYFNAGGEAAAIAGTGANGSTPGSFLWTNPGNITANDGTFANYVAGGDNETPRYLIASNFPIDVPADAEIVGIEFHIEGLFQENAAADEGYDVSVYAVKGGTVQTGTNKASATQWTNTFTTRTYGGPSDMWGNTWTESDVENSGFGVAFTVVLDTDDEFRVDHVAVTVYYTAGVAGDYVWSTGTDISDGAWTVRANATDMMRMAYATGDTEFTGDVTAPAFVGDGSGLTGISAGVDGPVSSTDNAIARWNGTGGDTLQDGAGPTIDDSGNIVMAGTDTVDGRDVSADGTKLDGIATGASVSSVGITPTDGLEVDSGSPVTGAGSITLGLHAANTWAHLISGASTVTGVGADSLLIADASNGGALGEMLVSDLVLAIASTDNRMPRFDGTAGQLQSSGITVDDSNNVSGVGTLNTHTIPGGTAAFVVTTGTQVLTGKLINPVETTDNSSPYAIGNVETTARLCTITHSSGPATVSAPTGSPANGVIIRYMIDNVGMAADSITWDAVFVSGEEWGLAGEIPEISGTSGTWTSVVFEWNAGESEWTLLAFSTGN